MVNLYVPHVARVSHCYFVFILCIVNVCFFVFFGQFEILTRNYDGRKGKPTKQDIIIVSFLRMTMKNTPPCAKGRFPTLFFNQGARKAISV